MVDSAWTKRPHRPTVLGLTDQGLRQQYLTYAVGVKLDTHCVCGPCQPGPCWAAAAHQAQAAEEACRG
eukprot:8543242-Pyramimonas_sp.AAC.1